MTTPQTTLKKDAVGVVGILFFVLSAQAPLTSVVGVAAIAITLGNGAAFPSAYLIIGIVMLVFSVGFTTMTRYVTSHGGFSSLIHEGIGFRAGSSAAWLALLTYSSVQAALYGLISGTASGLLHTYLGIDVPWWVIFLVVISGILVLGTNNVEVGARVLAVLVTGEFLILFVFGLLVYFGGNTAEGIDVAATFGPQAIMTGAPGIGLLFAIASMFGFESTTIYSSEAKDPQRTVPRATYLAVIVIAAFLAFALWSLVLYYGPSNVQGAAAATLEGDPAAFVTEPLDAVLGPWAGPTAATLLVTSLVAALLSFHNIINRYLHSMAGRGFLPAALHRTNRHHAPANAAFVQTATALLVVVPFALLDMNPIVTLFGWLSGLGVVALVLLYLVASIAVIAYFRRTRADTRVWNTLLAPILATVMMGGLLVIMVSNFSVLTAADPVTGAVLLCVIPVVLIVGWALASVSKDRSPVEPEEAELAP
ncbi:MAG: APC family permease [Microbacterium sp.]|uniref:APC family permease n=1 Tax=Microbacterium sp. TaxID=51671 RepID=UPI0039E4B577